MISGVVRFKVGDNGYLADILVGIRRNQNAELYDIVNIVPTKITETSNDSVVEKSTQISGEVSVNSSILQNAENVNTFEQKNSEKVSDSYSKEFLSEEDKQKIRAEERRRYLERQLVQLDPLGRKAKAVSPNIKGKIASEIARDMPDVTTRQVAEKLTEVFNVIEHPKSLNVNDFNAEVRAAAQKAAAELYSEWRVANVNPLYDEYNNIYKEISSTPLKVSDDIKKDFDNYGDFFKENFGKLKFNNNGLGVDVVYERLYSVAPALFADDNGQKIYAPSDQLRKIAEVREMIGKESGHPSADPRNMLDENAENSTIEAIANSIIASYVDNAKLTISAQNRQLSKENARLEQQAGEAKAKEAVATLSYIERWYDAETKKYHSDVERQMTAMQNKIQEGESRIEEIQDSLARQGREKLRYVTLQKINRLMTLAMNPTKTKNLPEAYRKTVLDFLTAVGDVELLNGKKITSSERAKLENLINKTDTLREHYRDIESAALSTGDNSTVSNRAAIIK